MSFIASPDDIRDLLALGNMRSDLVKIEDASRRLLAGDSKEILNWGGQRSGIGRELESWHSEDWAWPADAAKVQEAEETISNVAGAVSRIDRYRTNS